MGGVGEQRMGMGWNIVGFLFSCPLFILHFPDHHFAIFFRSTMVCAGDSVFVKKRFFHKLFLFAYKIWHETCKR